MGSNCTDIDHKINTGNMIVKWVVGKNAYNENGQKKMTRYKNVHL